MSVTTDDLLRLAGRLDDAPGFDSPRERFRRFLHDHVRTPAIARALIEQTQHAPGEQHRRALQDLVMLLGRLLGFDVTFGTYLPVAGAVKFDGQWQSGSRLQLIVELRADYGAEVISVDSLVRSVAAASTTSAARTAGLCVLASTFVGRHRIEEAIAAAGAPFPISIVSVQTLLTLADLGAAGRITHADVVRLFEMHGAADFVVDLIERAAGTRPAESDKRESPPPSLPVSPEPGYWIATVVRDYATRPEEFLELVVGRRQIFGIMHTTDPSDVVAKHDWICFYIAGKGVVGRAQVTSLADSGSIRDAHRFRQLLNVRDVSLHLTAPLPVDAETDLRLQSLAPAPGRPTQTLIRITRESFAALTPGRPAQSRAVSASGYRESE